MRRLFSVAAVAVLGLALAGCCNTGCNPCQKTNTCNQPNKCNTCNTCNQPNTCAKPCSPCGR